MGLTNSSVVVQYRALETVSTDPVRTAVLDWVFLAEVNLTQDISQPIRFTLNDTDQGVQFRFLQLEHGGGECNCWELNKALGIFLDDIMMAMSLCIQTATQLQVSDTAGAAQCGLSASEPRGAVTIGYYFTGSDGERCPGNSSVGLISDQGPPLPQNCATTSPRM